MVEVCAVEVCAVFLMSLCSERLVQDSMMINK